MLIASIFSSIKKVASDLLCSWAEMRKLVVRQMCTGGGDCVWFMDMYRLGFISCLAWGTNAPRNSVGQGRWGDGGRTEWPSCSSSSISPDKPGPLQGLWPQLLSNGRYGAGAPPWALGTLLLGQQTQWALSTRSGLRRLMEQVQAGCDNHLA